MASHFKNGSLFTHFVLNQLKSTYSITCFRGGRYVFILVSYHYIDFNKAAVWKPRDSKDKVDSFSGDSWI